MPENRVITGRPGSIPYVETGDPKWAYQNERARAANFGQQLEDEYDQYGRPFYGQETDYRQQADRAYAPIGAGYGGYTPDEAYRIGDYNRLNSLEYTPEEYRSQFYTPEEAAAIQADPSRVFDYYDPNYLRSLDEQAAGNLRGAYESGARGVRDTYENYGPIGFDESLRGRVDAAVDPNLLRLDPNFAGKYVMSDADVEAQANLGAKAGAVPYQSIADEASRQAFASGTVNPLFVGYLKARMGRQAAIGAADAATRARLEAQSAQRGQRRDVEGMRLGAEQGYSDRAVNSQLNLERLRQAAEQYRAGLITENQYRLLQSKLGVESDIADRMAGTGRYNTEVGTGLAQYADTAGSNRAGQVAGQRVEASRYGSGERYNRGTQLSDARSQRAQSIADQRRADEREYRGYVTGQQQYAGQRANQEADRRLRGYEDTSRVTFGSAQGLATKPKGLGTSLAQSWLSPGGLFSAAGTAGDGGLVTKPTVLLTGEKGPELIVPLYPSDSEQFTINGKKMRRPSMGDHGDGTTEHSMTHYDDGGSY